MDDDGSPEDQREALERAMVTHIAGLRRYARALLGRRGGDAEDLVQESLARALARLRPWTPVRDLRSYLFTILHNLYIDEFRSRRAAPVIFDLDNIVHHPAAPPNQDRRLELRDLARGIDHLADEQREVLLLVGLEGLSYADAARVLDIPIGTVMSRLSRARRQLRALMQANEMPKAVARRKPS